MSLDVYRRKTKIMLTDEQWEMHRRIWSTDRCPRKQEYRILGTPSLKQHFVSFRGTVGHSIIEAELKGEEPDYYRMFEDYPEARIEVLQHYDPITTNLRKWRETTTIDLSEAEAEVKYERDLELGYVLVRKIDIMTPTHILDTKFGKKMNRMDYRIDLANSWEMVKDAGDGVYDPDNVGLIFLGGPEPEELFPFQKRGRGKETPIEEALEAAHRNIRECIFYRERIRAGEVTPCAFGIWCGTCPWRHVCNGYPPVGSFEDE